jgi:osomolarity two-component system sensor histidine kinase SLN1
MLGDPEAGYPPMLYPNLTYTPTSDQDPGDPTTNRTIIRAFHDVELTSSSYLLLGPIQLNSTFAILSLTLPIINNTSDVDILGFMT